MTRVVEPFREYTAWFRKVRQLPGGEDTNLGFILNRA